MQTTLGFIEGRLEDRSVLEWALKLDATKASERHAIRLRVERKDPGIAEPYLLAWRLVFQFWDRPDPGSNYDRLLLKQDLQQMGSPREDVRLIVDAVRPWLKLDSRRRIEALYGSPARPKRPRSIHDLLYISVSSGEALTPDDLKLGTITDLRFLEELAKCLDAALYTGLALGRDIGAIDDNHDNTDWLVHRAYFVPAAQWEAGGGEPDRHSQGYANSAKLLHAVIERIAVLRAPVARRLISALPYDDWNLYRRLWAALARDPTLVSAEQVETFLLGLSDESFWLVHFPEVAELRATRWNGLSAPVRGKLETRLIRGMPVRLRPKRLSGAEAKAYSERRADAELQRLRQAGGTISARALVFLAKQAAAGSHQLLSVTDGFAAGVRVYSTSAREGGRFTDLSQPQLLAMLAGELADDDSEASSYLGENPKLALQLLAEATVSIDLKAKIWRALGYYHRPPDQNVRLEDADAATLEAAATAEGVLTDILGQEEDIVAAQIEALSTWLDTWKKLLKNSAAFVGVWRKLWPPAVATVNAVTPSRPLRERAHISPTGALLSAIFQTLPTWKAGAADLKDTVPWKEILEVLAAVDGDAQLQVRYRMLESLGYFYQSSPLWAQENLVRPLQEATEATMELWGAIGGTGRLPPSEIMPLIGPGLATAANSQALSQTDRSNLAQMVIWSNVLSRLPEPRSAAVAPNLVQQMLRMGDDHLRHSAVRALKHFLDKPDDLGLDSAGAFAIAKAVFEQVWPRERTLNSPTVAEALVELPAASGISFSSASAMVMPYLVPFDCWSLYDYGIWATADDGKTIRGVKSETDAKALLEMMDRTIGDQEGAVIPLGLDQALKHIVGLSPTSETDPRYQRLLTLSRR